MALKQIEKDQVRAGMWIHAIKGVWFFHPFWRGKFLLEHSDDVDALRSARISGVVIDTDKGLDIKVEPPRAANQPAPPPPATAPAPQAAPRAPAKTARITKPRLAPVAPAVRQKSALPQTCSMTAELGRARKTVNLARRLMSQLLRQVRTGDTIDAEKLGPLVDEIADSLSRNNSTLTSVLRLKRKDEYTYMHSVTVSALMINLARELDFTEEKVREAGMAGLLHDIGKMAIDDSILNKAGRLTDAEFASMRQHPERGHSVLRKDDTLSALVMDVALHHHEKMDGTGYPHRLSGDEITLLARMGAVCDVYDAVTSDRPYKAPWTPAEAIHEMLSWNGHFDEYVLAAFVRSVGVYPVGSLVRISGDRLAIVIETHRKHPERPTVRVFASTTPGTTIEPDDINLAETQEDILSFERPADWELHDWEERWPEIARGTLKSLKAQSRKQ